MSTRHVLPARLAGALLAFVVILGCTSHPPAAAAVGPIAAASSGDLEIKFLKRAPVIDGTLDSEAVVLPVVPLPYFDGSDGATPAGSVFARLGYGADFLYLTVEAPQDRIQCRDRAYQNGDGIILALASPRGGDGETDEFQVLGFSPQAPIGRSWQYAFTWYKDRDWIGFPPLRGARFAWSCRDGRATFEVLVPWTEVAPYHPWFRSAIGLNIAYTQAVGRQGVIDYQLVADPLLQNEVSPRLYRRARFEVPSLERGLTLGVSLETSHATEGTPLVVQVAAQGAAETALSTSIHQGTRTLAGPSVTVKAAGALAVSSTPVDTTGLAPGEYELEVRDPSGATRRMPFGILPALDPGTLRAELALHESSLAPGTRSTLQFRIQEVERSAAQLKPHALGSSLGGETAALERDFQAVRRGEDPVAKRTGVLRRAFRSRIDDTLQPYSIRPVSAPRPGRTYPMVVFLHGSAMDDRGQLDGVKGMLPGFILVAPNARGTSHYYDTKEAQEDIQEVLADVMENYPVDPARIFLAGFSMGGYGVYRTFFQDPMRFRGLIILSGVPFAGGSSPDFRAPANLAGFRDVQMFIAHGTEDRNCPYTETVAMVEQLRETGARVEFVSQRGLGHQSPTLLTMIRMMGWLQRRAKG
jgi:predicted esterase